MKNALQLKTSQITEITYKTQPERITMNSGKGRKILKRQQIVNFPMGTKAGKEEKAKTQQEIQQEKELIAMKIRSMGN